MDRGERAKYEYLSATGYLPEKLSGSGQQRQRLKVTDVSTDSHRSLCDVGFLELSQTPNSFSPPTERTEAFLDTVHRWFAI